MAGRSANLPVVTLLIAAGSLAAALLAGADELLVYDRGRVLAGEAWRLLTGHVVHFSPSHAGWDLAVFALAGGWLERHDRAAYLRLLALTVAACGAWFLAVLPDMARYGGLSGLASAAVVSLTLQGIRHGGQARPLWAAVLLLFAAKLAYEFIMGKAVFAATGTMQFEVVPSTHVIGALAAIVLFLPPGGLPASGRYAEAGPPARAGRGRGT